MDRTLSELSLETHKEAFQAIDLRGQPGAAGVVTNNLVALGAETAAISFIGHDGNGYTLKNALENKGVNTEYLIETEKRVTPTYTKPLMLEVDKQNIELNRIDIINRSPTPEQINLALLKKVRKAVSSYNGILVLEQVNQDGYGVMSPLLRNGLGEMASEYPEKIIMVDSRHFAARYFSVSLKMNLSEAANTAGNLNPEFVDIDQEDQISAADKLASRQKRDRNTDSRNHREATRTTERGRAAISAAGSLSGGDLRPGNRHRRGSSGARPAVGRNAVQRRGTGGSGGDAPRHDL